MGVKNNALLELIGDVIGLVGIAQFRVDLLASLKRVMQCDWISLNDIGPGVEDATVLIDPPFPPEAHALFARMAHENPLIARYDRTRDGRAYRFSDVVTPSELHRLSLYREFYGPIGLEHQIAFTLPSTPTRLLGVAMSRSENDFADEERDLLNDARPFLIQAYRNAIDYENLKGSVHARVEPRSVEEASLASALVARGLTPREAEVLLLIATGRSDQSAAEALGVSTRTVQKHLQRCYRKLGVKRRSDAAKLARALLPQ